MKKTLVAAILGIAGSVATSNGQGVVLFNNYQSQFYNPVVYGTGTGNTVGSNVNDPNVEVALFYAIGTYANTTTFFAASTAASSIATAFINNTINQSATYGVGPGGFYIDSTPASIAGGWTTNSTVTFAVEGWETTGVLGGATYALANEKGITALWTEVTDPNDNINSPGTAGFGIVPSADPADYFGYGPPTLTLNAVPEPATLALAGLGGLAALVMVRRRKMV